MTALTLRQITSKAPGAAPVRGAARDGLLSTPEFLKFVDENWRFKPVLAVQGRGHVDASNDSPESMGRHFVVAASATSRGPANAVFLLNSHQKHRRAHIGFGLWDPERESFLIGPSAAVKRWKGYEDALKDMVMGHSPNLERVRETLHRTTMHDDAKKALGGSFSKNAYTDFVEARPSAKALSDEAPRDYLSFGFEVVHRMRKGNLQSKEKGGRNIKGVRRPDGLFHAGIVVYDGLVEMAISHGKLPAFCRVEPWGQRVPRA